MNAMRTILCSVDLSELSRREVDLAAELARTFGAGLVLHHNLPAAGFGMAKSWEWKQSHPGADAIQPAESGMREMARTVPDSVPVETLITSGPLALGMVGLAEDLPADLLVLGCHGCSTEEHASLTENLMRWCDCPILVLHEGEDRAWTLDLGGEREEQGDDGAADRPRRFLVPTDFSPAADEATRSAFWLAERLPVEIHLLHVLGAAVSDREAKQRLAARVPPELEERVVRHVEPGRVEDVILRLADAVGPDLVLMGEHARDPLRRYFTHDTARGVLHRAPCPVWFEPPPRAVA